MIEANELFVDLIPTSAWFSNLRSELTPDEWVMVKTGTYRAAHYRCEKCGGRGPEHPVECHERWHFDERSGVQTLLSTIALCPDCHEATHFGFARVKGRGDEARETLMRVNGWSRSEADRHIRDAMEVWKRRSRIVWTLDASWLVELFPDLSEATRIKILDHASGLRNRQLQQPEKALVDRVSNELGIRTQGRGFPQVHPPALGRRVVWFVRGLFGRARTGSL
jgi:hypothetical protein